MTSLYAQREEILLASASPRRRELLAQAGIAYQIRPADVDETPLSGESPQAMVERLAQAKARVGNFVGWLGADTTVVLDGKVLGKPENVQHARETLGALQGRMHEVWGGFALIDARTNGLVVESHVSRVWIVPLSASEIAHYVNTGEPMDKAGAYAIQGLGTQLVSRVEGSYTNVVGLNLAACIAALRRVGVLALPSNALTS